MSIKAFIDLSGPGKGIARKAHLMNHCAGLKAQGVVLRDPNMPSGEDFFFEHPDAVRVNVEAPDADTFKRVIGCLVRRAPRYLEVSGMGIRDEKDPELPYVAKIQVSAPAFDARDVAREHITHPKEGVRLSFETGVTTDQANNRQNIPMTIEAKSREAALEEMRSLEDELQQRGASSSIHLADEHWLKEPTHAQIAHRAEEIFRARGGEPGLEAENWLQAERELREGR